MNKLLIIGARGWGREIYNMLPDCIGYGTDFEVKGFLDDNREALNGLAGYPPIIDSVEHYVIHPNDVFICALGDVHYKKHYSEIIQNKGGVFINIIHKTAVISNNTTMGYGCVLADYVGISCDIRIGNFVTFQSYSIVGHDSQIGDYSHLGVRSFMGGFSSLGNFTTIQPHSVILPHVKVGNKCMVGAGAVVIKKVKDGDTVFGNPAKILKY